MDDPVELGLNASHQLTEGIIHRFQLPEQIGDRWRDLARAFGYSEAIIDATEKDKGSFTKECCIAILVRWVGREGRDATVGKLSDTLIKIQLKSLAEKLMCVDSSQDGEYEKAIGEMKRNCKQLEQEGAKMRARIKELEETLSSTTQKYQEAEQEVLEMGARIKQLEEQLQDSEQRCSKLSAEKKDLEENLAIRSLKQQNTSQKDLDNFEAPTKAEDVSGASTDDLDTDQETRERQMFRQLKNLDKELKIYVTEVLEVPEVKQDKLRTAVKLDLLLMLSGRLQEMYTKVLKMAAETCKCSEDLKTEFYDFAYHGLRAEHNDLVARVIDLESFQAEMSDEEKEEFERLKQHQVNRQRQVDRLEKLWKGLSSSPESLPEATYSDPSRGSGKIEKASSRNYSDPGTKEQAKVPPTDDDDIGNKCKVYFTKVKQSSVRGMFRKKESTDNIRCALLYPQEMKNRE